MVDNKKKSVRKYEQSDGQQEPPKQSGRVAKRRPSQQAAPAQQAPVSAARATPDESQLRRRLSFDAKIESPRSGGLGSGAASGFGRRQNTKPIPLPDPGPGFMINEPESDSGVPTPKPRLPMSLIPKRTIDERRLMNLPLDHRAGFVLGHIDGTTNIRTLMDVCGMTQDELSELIDRLVELKVIKLT